MNHEVTIERVHDGPEMARGLGRSFTWRGVCSCGWTGEPHLTTFLFDGRWPASFDAIEHLDETRRP